MVSCHYHIDPALTQNARMDLWSTHNRANTEEEEKKRKKEAQGIKMESGGGGRERQRDRDRERQRERQTDRQTETGIKREERKERKLAEEN